MKRSLRIFPWLLAATSLAGPAVAADAPAAALAGTDLPKVQCVAGLERILPGDYYGCRALYHLQRGHYGQAVAMLKEAAYWANKEAQHQLGLAYFDGDLPGLPADPARGIAWLALARERHQLDDERDYATAVTRATPAQRERAGTIYLALRRRYGDAVAGKRATDRFNREMRAIDDAANGGVAWVSGFGPFPTTASALSRQLHAQAEQDFAGLQGSVLVGPLQRVQDRVDTATLKPRGAAGDAAHDGGH